MAFNWTPEAVASGHARLREYKEAQHEAELVADAFQAAADEKNREAIAAQDQHARLCDLMREGGVLAEDAD